MRCGARMILEHGGDSVSFPTDLNMFPMINLPRATELYTIQAVNVRRYLWEQARRSAGEIARCGAMLEEIGKMERDAGRYPRRYNVASPKTLIPATHEPEDIHIVVAGGRSYFAAVLPGWGFGGVAVTRQIRRPDRS